MMRFQAFGEQREPIAKACDNFYLSRRSVAKMLLAASMLPPPQIPSVSAGRADLRLTTAGTRPIRSF